MLRLFRFLKPYWWQVIILLFATGLQVYTVLRLPALMADIINHGIVPGDTDYIWMTGLRMIGLTVISAAGSLKKGRKDTRYNAVMPLRGKVKNVKDSSADQAMDNKELFTIFKLIGLGIDVNNVTKDAKTPEEAYELIQRYTRFSKIVIATDADEDY